MDTYHKLKSELKDLEQKLQNNKDHQQLQNLKGQMNEILTQDVRKKTEFL